MVVGGYAVNFHGYERSTSDLDVWVKPSEENKHALYNALLHLDYPKKALEQILNLDFTKPFLFCIGNKPNDVEIFNSISGISFDEAEPHKIRFNKYDEAPVYFIGLQDLIINKMISGRTKDKLDVEELQKINDFKK
jgi:hypothetical protein